MNNPIDNTGIFDSRDLIEYRDYLLDELIEEANDEFEQDFETFEEVQEYINSVDEPECYLLDDQIEEFESVRDFCDELNYGDFQYGEAIISEDYFTEYAEELVKDCGYLHNDLPSWIENNIDWDGVAGELKQDYMEVDFKGTTYLMRA